MGQKVHPIGIRLGIVKGIPPFGMPDSKQYAKQLISDLEVRQLIEKNALIILLSVKRLLSAQRRPRRSLFIPLDRDCYRKERRRCRLSS